jgi:ATP phosphoribosyltransferase
MPRKLTLALPKGSLQEQTFRLLGKAGFQVRASSRSYYPSIDDPEMETMLVRAQDISRFVERGTADAGLTGEDWVAENGSDVKAVANLAYAKQNLTPVRWVIAVPERSRIRSVKGLRGKRIATELVNVTRKFLRRNGVKAAVEFSHGATEAKVPHLVDAIVELTETGSSLRANRLREIGTVITSTTVVVANRTAWRNAWKRRKLQNLTLLLQGAMDAEGKVCIKMNVPARRLDTVVRVLPALRRPTVSPLADSEWVAIESVVDEAVVRELLPSLKKAGAQGIIEFPLNKVIL